MVYLDNAATTVMSSKALKALSNISKLQYGNPSAIYAVGREARAVLEEARRIIAECIGADPEEIFFTSGGTESNNWVISEASNKFQQVIVSSIEHHAILHPVAQLQNEGVTVVYLPVDSECRVSSKVLENLLGDHKTLVSIMFQNNETGVLQEIESMAEMVHRHNSASLFHTDAVQAVGHCEINVHALGVDLLSASAHKFNGPKGVGFLYIKKGCEMSSLILGGGQERGLRSGTENVAGIYAMAKALEENTALLKKNQKKIKELEKCLLQKLIQCEIPFSINGKVEKKAAGILNLSVDGVDGEGLLHYLDLNGIYISTGSACNSKTKVPSHVLSAMGLDSDRIDSAIRISIGRYNTEEDVAELVKCIEKYYGLLGIAHCRR